MFQLKKFENYKTFEITTQYNFNALKLHVIYWNSPRVSCSFVHAKRSHGSYILKCERKNQKIYIYKKNKESKQNLKKKFIRCHS